MIVEAGKCLQGQIFRMDLVGSGLDRVGAGVVWMRGGDACIAIYRAHRRFIGLYRSGDGQDGGR